MKIRPHHLLDIITEYGRGLSFSPDPNGNALHQVAEDVLSGANSEVEFNKLTYFCFL